MNIFEPCYRKIAIFFFHFPIYYAPVFQAWRYLLIRGKIANISFLSFVCFSTERSDSSFSTSFQFIGELTPKYFIYIAVNFFSFSTELLITLLKFQVDWEYVWVMLLEMVKVNFALWSTFFGILGLIRYSVAQQV